MRDLAIVLAIALALPALVLIVRDVVAAADPAAGRADRLLHVVWSAVPVVLLVVLMVLAVRG
jgi:heme/copper-type cytochrome/quinol oxidase subunit 2